MARMVNRSAALVRPREPFVKWAMTVDSGGNRHLESQIRSQVSVYLVPPDRKGREEAAPLEQWYSGVFSRELENWYRDEATWPPDRDLEMFLAWFEVSTNSVVIDVGRGYIETEEV